MKKLPRQYFNPNDGHIRAMNLLYGRVVNLRHGINQGYWFYMNNVNLHGRINNRSYMQYNFDGAMVLSYWFNRRKEPKCKPCEIRRFYTKSFPFS